MNEDLIAIAKLVRTRGLRGELVADLLTDFPERFDDLENVIAVAPNNKRRELIIENFWFQKERIILKFKGFNSIEAAEMLRDHEICVPATETVKLTEDEFFDWQLEGCEVFNADGTKLGAVAEIMRNGATEILVVASAIEGKKDFLIPFVNEFCRAIDIENKLIRVDVSPEILDF